VTSISHNHSGFMLDFLQEWVKNNALKMQNMSVNFFTFAVESHSKTCNFFPIRIN